MINVEVNIDPLVRKLHMITDKVGYMIPEATREALNHIHQKAMENLNSNLIWGHGVIPPIAEMEQIANSVEINPVTGTLTYTSPHARLLEYGGPVVYQRPHEMGPMPIGQREGHTEGFGYNIFTIVQGKYFLTQAFITEREVVKRIYENYLNRILRELS